MVNQNEAFNSRYNDIAFSSPEGSNLAAVL